MTNSIYPYYLVEVIKNPKKNSDKRFLAIFSNKKQVEFGYANFKNGTYIDHKSIDRKKNYIKRHEKDLRTNDPQRAGYLSIFLLWNLPTLKASIKDYNKRLKNGNFKL